MPTWLCTGRRRAPDPLCMTAVASGDEGSRWSARELVAPLRAAAARLSLAHRFALLCLVVLVSGAFIIGSWVSREIESGVIHRTAAVTALYVDSVVVPHLTGLESGALSGPELRELASLLNDTSLGQKIVSFKVWSTEGEVVFARDAALIGNRYQIAKGLRSALEGNVTSHLSDLSSDENRFERQFWPRLVETYSPVRAEDGRVIGSVEFYQLPDELLQEIRTSQFSSWAIVGVSTVAMYLLLVGLVAGASSTITRQNRSLKQAFEEQTALQGRIRRLNQRLRQAASGKVQTDEELLRRLAQDLHDGPAQDLALALMRLDALEREDPSEDESAALESIYFSLTAGLEEIRSLSTELRLPQIEGLGWRAVVEKAVADHRHRTGSTVHVAVADMPIDPSGSQRIAVYRVIQEALSNASRHSGAAEQWVSLSQESGTCVLTIRDNGKGFEVGRGSTEAYRRPRLGLQGMRERVELLGGSVDIESGPGKGTTITARFALEGGESP